MDVNYREVKLIGKWNGRLVSIGVEGEGTGGVSWDARDDTFERRRLGRELRHCKHSASELRYGQW